MSAFDELYIKLYQPRPLPKAWLGYKWDRTGGTVRPSIKICAWCETKKEAEEEAKRMDLPVTHSICPDCAQKRFSQQLGERAD